MNKEMTEELIDDLIQKNPNINGKLLSAGKTKKIYTWPDDDRYAVMEFTDFVTAGDGELKDEVPGKGALSRDLSVILFKEMEKAGVKTHLSRFFGEKCLLVHFLNMCPIESVFRFRAAGSFCRRYGTASGKIFDPGLQEFFIQFIFSIYCFYRFQLSLKDHILLNTVP